MEEWHCQIGISGGSDDTYPAAPWAGCTEQTSFDGRARNGGGVSGLQARIQSILLTARFAWSRGSRNDRARCLTGPEGSGRFAPERRVSRPRAVDLLLASCLRGYFSNSVCQPIFAKPDRLGFERDVAFVLGHAAHCKVVLQQRMMLLKFKVRSACVG
ncbi:hypothetical protein K469DRAFT_335587 [Zopfia rhizophila CBS 207.26]|uniref:Uncharacterized protein n=1 Tax=Zopfia rhizophila CBS 207.26 TaxID=1314779 RepID=A0A6A6DFP1_9PEZI|nr:hypothetical protein K469DRAFT_335587 [Zopfia rhizophila CBS 207.26]